MSADPPSLSIVIPSHHRADLLHDCLSSVTHHAPPRTEIIVVDDGSFEAIISSTAHAFRAVRVVRLARRCGFCVAANQGIRSAQGSIIQLLNDDTIVTPGWASVALSAFAASDVGAVAPLVFQGFPNAAGPIRIDSAGDEYDLGGFAYKRGHHQAATKEMLKARDVFGASGSSAFYRRSALARVGLFPEEFGAYFEDVDLSWRLQRAGYRIVYEPQSQVWHRCGSSQPRQNRRLLEQQSLNEERVFWRNVPGSQMWKAIPRHVAVLMGKTIRRVREGTLIPFLMGRFRALGEFRSLLQQRKIHHGEKAEYGSRP